MTRFYDSLLALSGLGISQFALLTNLDIHGSMRMGQLADRLAMDRATLGHNVRPLERDGLIGFERSEEDARAKVVGLTELGRAKLAEARPLWAQAQARFETAVGAGEAAQLRGLLEVVSSQWRDGLAPVGRS